MWMTYFDTSFMYIVLSSLLWLSSMVSQLRMCSLFEQEVISVCSQYRENVLNTVIPDSVACFSQYNFVAFKITNGKAILNSLPSTKI